MAHAAVIASVLEPGELICPFVVLTNDEDRQSLEFEAATQDQAVSLGWESLEKCRDTIDKWAFAREGLMSERSGMKVDVLVVAVWAHGMAEPAIFSHRFQPADNGGFALLGPLMVQDQPGTELDRISKFFLAGIAQHPKGNQWSSWYREA
jgi:hypothetical protein